MIPFVFDEVQHVYKVEGNYCLATSDVLYLNGLSNYDGVPSHVLEKARNRGTNLHKAVQYFEEGTLDVWQIKEEMPELYPYFQGYMRFRSEREFEPIPPQEKAIVYEHENTGQLVGCHIDMRGRVGNDLYIVDPKCTYPNSGAAKKQTYLRWRMQLQSYHEATMTDEQFWEEAGDGPIKKAILHLMKDGTYRFLDAWPEDDALSWDAMVRVAQLKLANGYKRDNRPGAIREDKMLEKLQQMVPSPDEAEADAGANGFDAASDAFSYLDEQEFVS